MHLIATLRGLLRDALVVLPSPTVEPLQILCKEPLQEPTGKAFVISYSASLLDAPSSPTWAALTTAVPRDSWLLATCSKRNNMYVYMYIYIYTHIFPHICMHACAWMHAGMHACMHACMYVCISIPGPRIGMYSKHKKVLAARCLYRDTETDRYLCLSKDLHLYP